MFVSTPIVMPIKKSLNLIMELLLNVHLVRLWVPDGFLEQIHWSMRKVTSYSSNI